MDSTSSILDELYHLHRDLFDVLFLTENRPNHLQPSDSARLYLLDSSLVSVYHSIRSEELRLSPSMRLLHERIGLMTVSPWAPRDVRMVA